MTRLCRGRRALLPVLIAGLVSFALGLVAFASSETDKASPGAISVPADGLPAITLIDQQGRPLSLASLKGRPALVAFIHTQCEGPCELITGHMKQVAQTLGAGFHSEVTMISITTEPEEDRSSELLAYAKAQGVEGRGWVFLTGASANIRRLLALYGVLAEEKKSDHVLELFLLAADGAAMRRYNGVTTPVQAIAADIRKTAALH
ncbi:MAG TPA: SCO family protein [Candidatus Binataceae bacterium]|nr:SCO family protein [Candidatus Binataceae bacterium]